MRNILFIVLCSFGFSDALNVQLLSFLPFDVDASDITGFAQDGREFAVMGLVNGATFVDVTDPYNPFEVGRISGSNSIWRDLKYWNEHVYIGTEADDGIKIVDVSNLDNPVLVNTITDVDNSHNVHIDADGFLYIVGADTYDTWIYDLTDPAQPELVGTWSGEYLHDIEVYNDKLYGAAIYSGLFYIIDVSDKSNPQTLISFDTGGGYVSTHDCAITADEQYLITADETTGGHIKIFDISDYSNINHISSYSTPDNETHTSHNVYIQESTGLMIISYYADGTRFVDISDPYNPLEVGYYDTTEIEGLYPGNWGTYVDLPSGNVISSDIEQGLFVLKFGGLSIEHTPMADTNIDAPVTISATVTSMTSIIEDVTLHVNLSNEWSAVNMAPSIDDAFNAEIDNENHATVVRYYITATDDGENNARYPIEGYLLFTLGELDVSAEFDFESGSQQWIAGSPSDNASAGLWEWGNPNGTADQFDEVQPEDDHTVNGTQCFVTGNSSSSLGSDDVDNGKTTLLSPIIDLANMDDALLSYWKWYANDGGDNPGNDHWYVDVSNDGGSTWTELENTSSSWREWQQKRILLSEYTLLSNAMQFRFIAEDIQYNGDNGSGGSIVEAAIDDVLIQSIHYSECINDGDVNNDGGVNVLDIVNTVNAILDETPMTDEFFCAADINQDLVVNILDIVIMVNLILE
ncbi:MAG: choice-of-anchor B family protein [Candidatus Marinimicrobia bacterium]|nr:choice-of-anchor B family protein [Candidatus Neomarinimicrobiota bacterium]